MTTDHTASVDPVSRPAFSDVVVLLGDGRLGDRAQIESRFGATEFEAINRLLAALRELSEYRFVYLDNHDNLFSDLMIDPPGFVLNFCDTGFRNDGRQELHIPALLDMLAIPYSGAGPAALAICHDKALVRAVASAHGVPVPSEIFVDTGMLEVVIPFKFPALLKLNCGDGSVGLTPASVVHSMTEVQGQLARMRAEFPGRDVLAQEFLSGPEYSVGVIGNPGLGFTILPVLEVDYRGLELHLPRILSYASKNDPRSLYWRQITYREARIDNATRQQLIAAACLLFKRLGCCDYARFDFRTDAIGQCKLLDVNPNPAWCWDGKLNRMAAFAGYSYAEFLRRIIATAQHRIVNTGGAELVDDVASQRRHPRRNRTRANNE